MRTPSYAKLSKCDFYKPQIQYLGHIISEKGIAIDPENIKSIEDWTTPTCVTDIRSFWGLAVYYRNFIEKFLRIVCPMTALKKKENKFLWTTKREEIFQKLMYLLTTTPIIQIVNSYGNFVVCTDASKEGLGGVLMQNDCTIYYEP